MALAASAARSTIATAAPRAASSSETAPPIPMAPPVTSADLPENSFSASIFFP